MKEPVGTTGLILNEPLLWEKGSKGRTGMSIPKSDVPRAAMDNDLAGVGPRRIPRHGLHDRL